MIACGKSEGERGEGSGEGQNAEKTEDDQRRCGPAPGRSLANTHARFQHDYFYPHEFSSDQRNTVVSKYEEV